MPEDEVSPGKFTQAYHALNARLAGISDDVRAADKGNKAAIRRVRHALQSTKEDCLTMRKELADAGRKEKE